MLKKKQIYKLVVKFCTNKIINTFKTLFKKLNIKSKALSLFKETLNQKEIKATQKLILWFKKRKLKYKFNKIRRKNNNKIKRFKYNYNNF